MGEVIIIGVDLAKNVFQVHGAAADGSVQFRKKLTRPQFARFMAEQPPCLVAMEACARGTSCRCGCRAACECCAWPAAFVNEAMDEELVYQLTRAWWDNIAEVAEIHPLGKALDISVVAEHAGDIPIHPGALRYYVEVGVIDGDPYVE